MGEIISPRGWTAMAIVIVTAAIIGAIGAGLDAAALSLVGGAAAVLATTAGRLPRPEQPVPTPQPTLAAPIDLQREQGGPHLAWRACRG
jgi:two-component system phosphate regulon sensor histidine kinase PhoR